MLDLLYERHMGLIKSLKALESGSVLVTIDSGTLKGEFKLNALSNEEYQVIINALFNGLENYEKFTINEINTELKNRGNNGISFPVEYSDISSG